MFSDPNDLDIDNIPPDEDYPMEVDEDGELIRRPDPIRRERLIDDEYRPNQDEFPGGFDLNGRVSNNTLHIYQTVM